MPLTTYTAGEVLTAASLNANFTFAAGSSGVVQVKSTTLSDTFTMSSTTFTDVTGLTVSITPTNATNKVLIMVSLLNGSDTNPQNFARLMRDSTAIGIGDAAGSRTRVTSADTVLSIGQTNPMSMLFLDSPNTTSATTYKVQIAANSAGTITVNRSSQNSDSAGASRGISTITVMEVTP